MPASSNAFEAGIRTSETLRTLVVASGWSLLVAGLVCVTGLPLLPLQRIAVGVVWLVLVAREIRRLQCAYIRYRYIRVFHDGSVSLMSARGTAVAARILPGSMLLRGIGWLRLKSADGARCSELVCGNCRKNKGWRRLQVIWRHL